MHFGEKMFFQTLKKNCLSYLYHPFPHLLSCPFTTRERTCFLILVKSNIENNIYGILKLMSKEKIYMYGFSLVHISSTCILFIDSNRSLLCYFTAVKINNSISTVKKKTIPDGQDHKDEMSDVGLHNEQALIENDISEQHENKKK